ncbi:MAG: ATPase, partial [Clostridia bacterium]|nr:ATPase [Clostridia bacterium]
MDKKIMITEGKTALGIELGSTRVKAVLIGEDSLPLASGSHEWENKLENGYWTYSLDDVHTALLSCFSKLKADVKEKYGCTLTATGAMGISAMMHGYLAFDKDGQLLTPFRTWRNTTTGEASEALTEALGFNIPQRWTVSHIYQAILNGEEHVPEIAYVTTLAGYVHYMLTGV